MTKEEKIGILKKHCNYKPDIYQSLELLECKIGVEIGVRVGNNFKDLIKNPKFKEGILYGVDCWTEDPEKPEINDIGLTQQQLDIDYLTLVGKYSANPNVKIIRNFSHEASLSFPNEHFDFIYIDAAHDYDSVIEDLNAWWPKLKLGGLFSGHDYFPDTRIWRGKECGVYKAVNEFAILKNTEVHHVTDTNREGGPGVSCNSFFIIK
tara:strand:+ start:251 stop:871 length:621 start_codon:yes stop_codon:yes gene_type:complete